ncbi:MULTISPECIES: carbohydrate ABC transporter permease [Micromonospora]|jgi:multiple sugar transport system permease protein|uniref:Sugar ABC transporter permease n=1 Tax=Micromonospora sicca TaxID=2202420 RepID=A0A317D2C1_9ACTN|nr:MULTISPECIES: carbohydrate ABC transporter permease [unclassified Micromonospora]MBM0224270.1 carbohydrate ABC transporter permease [Micromonospora sp. ATA51]PWR07996.1 sugar ABC transporter permease [Micromonospora sp. 4G51]
MTTTHVPQSVAPEAATASSTTASAPAAIGKAARLLALSAGAFMFLFPFYYMVVGSLQTEPDSSPGGAVPDPGDLSLDNYAAINATVPLGRALLNSAIYTGGVVIMSVVVGALTGYALAQLRFRGREALFTVLILLQLVPFTLSLIPLYILIVRDYGLGDTYLGMILPGAVNATGVFIFRQFFLAIPADLFDAPRVDGASELQVLRYVALPLIRPALLTVVLVTFIGPWNDFLWPFLVTKDRHMQPLAVALANYISSQAGNADNPFGAILAGAVVLAAPVVLLFVLFQRHFSATNLSSGVKG